MGTNLKVAGLKTKEKEKLPTEKSRQFLNQFYYNFKIVLL